MIMKLKKIKYLSCVIILIIFAAFLYQNYIYYKIPYNPIVKYSSDTINSFYITKNLPNGEEITEKTHNLNTCNLILKYFSDLKLTPIKDKSAWDIISKNNNGTYFTGMFAFDESGEVFINDIYLENLTILRISSFAPGFHDGYYKITGSEFDYNYIFDLISNSEE